MKPASKAFLLTLLGIIALSACRQADDGNYVRLAGNVFIFNYREAVATYVISLQRLRRLPPDSQWRATFDNPEGGAPQVIIRKIFPGMGNIPVESEPVYCITKGKPYAYKIEIVAENRTLQTISGTMISTLSQDILPEKPLVIGPGYEKNPDASQQNDAVKRALNANRCG